MLIDTAENVFDWMSENSALEESADPTSPHESIEDVPEPSEPEIPDVEYPGDDPLTPPDGYEWRGSGPQGSRYGNYFNPKTDTSLHPDLDHPQPIGPHWDYRDPSGAWWRIFKDGKISPKIEIK